jgi:hypothetical protein
MTPFTPHNEGQEQFPESSGSSLPGNDAEVAHLLLQHRQLSELRSLPSPTSSNRPPILDVLTLPPHAKPRNDSSLTAKRRKTTVFLVTQMSGTLLRWLERTMLLDEQF